MSTVLFSQEALQCIQYTKHYVPSPRCAKGITRINLTNGGGEMEEAGSRDPSPRMDRHAINVVCINWRQYNYDMDNPKDKNNTILKITFVSQ